MSEVSRERAAVVLARAELLADVALGMALGPLRDIERAAPEAVVMLTYAIQKVAELHAQPASVREKVVMMLDEIGVNDARRGVV